MRACTSRDKNHVSRDLTLAHPSAVRPGDDCALVKNLYLVVVQRLRVEAAQAGHFGQHVVTQGRPIELRVFHVPAETTRVFKVFREMRAVHQQLLGHAAANDAGAADAILLGDCNSGAMGRGHARRTHTAGTGTDYQKIIVALTGHE